MVRSKQTLIVGALSLTISEYAEAPQARQRLKTLRGISLVQHRHAQLERGHIEKPKDYLPPDDDD